MDHAPFVAIDFETANNRSDSACSIGLVKVKNGEIASTRVTLIRPPYLAHEFIHTPIHGIHYGHVASERSFGELWPELCEFISGAEFLVAHSAGFDRRVLESCCDTFQVPRPMLPFLCTVDLARKAWGIYPTKLPLVCDALGIPLKHHDALSDALASAQIVIRAMREQSEKFLHSYNVMRR